MSPALAGGFLTTEPPEKPENLVLNEIGGLQRRGVGEMGGGGQKVQTSSYKVTKSWDVMHSMVFTVNKLCCIFESC